MGLGIVFWYVAIAAVASPLLWLAWWGFDSLSSGRRLPVAVALHPDGRAKRPPETPSPFDYPRPTDTRSAGRPGVVSICSLSDGAEVDSCTGPDRAGRCPSAGADGTVPCAGTVLALPRPIRGSLEWHIPSGYRACLLGSYAAFLPVERRLTAGRT
jgi:hypothetical protein